jgi:hypothetical protein
MVYVHSHQWKDQKEIDQFVTGVTQKYGRIAGLRVNASNKPGQVIKYIGLSDQMGGGLKRLDEYNHGHIGILTEMNVTWTSKCLWRLEGGTRTQMEQMEFVFANIHPGAGHVLTGTGGVYGLNYALLGGGTYDVQAWHDALKETLGADGYYEYCIARLKNAHEASRNSLEFKYIKEFFTNDDYWAGGVAVPHPLLKTLLAAAAEAVAQAEALEKRVQKVLAVAEETIAQAKREKEAKRLAWRQAKATREKEAKAKPALKREKEARVKREKEAKAKERQAVVAAAAVVGENGSRMASKYRGVSWNKRSNKWQAEIRFDGKKHYLGRFEDEQEAARAYSSAAAAEEAKREKVANEQERAEANEEQERTEAYEEHYDRWRSQEELHRQLQPHLTGESMHKRRREVSFAIFGEEQVLEDLHHKLLQPECAQAVWDWIDDANDEQLLLARQERGEGAQLAAAYTLTPEGKKQRRW